MSIKEVSKKIFNYIKKNVLNILFKIKLSFIKSTKGEENFYVMLWGWGILPAVLFTFYLADKLERIKTGLISFPVCILIIVFFVWHIFAIRTTIKNHPEYKRIKEDKKAKYKGLNKKQIKELKQKERKERNVNLFKKAMLIKAWDSTEFYKIVILVDCFVILTQVQRILYIL